VELAHLGGRRSRNFPKENDPAILGGHSPLGLLICGFSVRFRGGSPLYDVCYSLTLCCEEDVDLAGGLLLERREDVRIGV
jgi:hypothetical protein